jgi:hypothetical protein
MTLLARPIAKEEGFAARLGEAFSSTQLSSRISCDVRGYPGLMCTSMRAMRSPRPHSWGTGFAYSEMPAVCGHSDFFTPAKLAIWAPYLLARIHVHLDAK